MIDLTPQQINEYLWKKSPLLWIVDNEIKTEKGLPMEFKNHKFLKDIYDDWTPIQVVRKASQVGFSTLEIDKTFNATRYRKWNIIYTLPTFGDVGQFVSSKVNALISVNPLFANLTKDKDTILQKRIGTGFIYYRGTFTSKKEKMESAIGTMFSADVLVMDECDRSDQAILEQYESRLKASKYKGQWYFSNPTNPFTLSQKVWEKSDQKHWFIKCPHCGHWQYLDFFKNIVNNKYVCQKCGKELSDEDRMNGQWVKKYKSDISGYWINHLMCPWITAAEIQKEYEGRDKQYFYNFILGLPYIGSDVMIDRQIILQAIDYSAPNFQQHNVLGVDQGLKKHWVLGNSQGIFKMGVTDKWEDIENLIKVYDVEIAVFDALPDLTEPRKLRDKYPGTIWLSYYKKEIQKADFITWDSDSRTVYSDRTKDIQMLIDEMINRKIRFQMKPEELNNYIEHWKSLYKVTEKDNLGIDRDVWETNGEDHYVHATIYFRLGLEKAEKGGTEIKSWEKQQEAYSGTAPDVKKMAEESAKNYDNL